MTNTGKVNIRGKEYLTVAYRIKQFRVDHPDWQIHTDIIKMDDDRVVVRAEIADSAGVTVATGHAEEKRSASQINQTSALENCESSAVGRALAFAGYGGSEIASADEVQNAIYQQENKPDPRVEKMTKAVNACGSLADLKTVWGAMSEADRKVMQNFYKAKGRGMSNHGANVVRITALCADLRDLTAASLLETKELEEVITRCMEIQKEAFHLQEWAMSALDMEYVKWVESKKHKLTRLMD
jgi:hypothetical protein